MGTTLSPFRYVQMAKYMLTKWMDHHPSTKVISRWKGKARAIPQLGAALLSGHRQQSRLEMNGVAQERRETAYDDVPGIAGPSTRRQPYVYEPLRPDLSLPPEPTEIYRLMNDPRLMEKGNVKPPREVVVLCHGLYGFSTATPIPLFPSLKLHYWASVLEVLRDQMGVNVLVVGVKGTGSIKERAEQMHEFLKSTLPKGTGVNFVAHSMGGLDCRHLISNIRPTSYTPLSLTAIGTPHRGSPFMDWCAANIGVGSIAAAAAAMGAAGASSKAMKMLPYSLKSPLLSRPMDGGSSKDMEKKDPSSGFAGFTSALTTYLLNIFDSPAYSNLTTSFLRDQFNPNTPDDPSVKYISVAGRTTKMSVLHPLWFPKLVLDAAAENGYAEDEGSSGKKYEGNDGLVSVSSAKWGEFIGAVDYCHHWDLRGEGGLFPQVGSYSGKPDPGHTCGSSDVNGTRKDDWKNSTVGEHLGLTAKAKMEKTINDAQKLEATAKEREHDKQGGGAGSWDIAQVGQVLDWVGDLLPGKSTETQKKGLEDAQREKEKDEARRSGTDLQERKNRTKKNKFDLARFYGGLMIKLREDGF